jgi:hypothetical protein
VRQLSLMAALVAVVSEQLRTLIGLGLVRYVGLRLTWPQPLGGSMLVEPKFALDGFYHNRCLHGAVGVDSEGPHCVKKLGSPVGARSAPTGAREISHVLRFGWIRTRRVLYRVRCCSWYGTATVANGRGDCIDFRLMLKIEHRRA